MLNKKLLIILLAAAVILNFASCDEEEIAYVTVDLSVAPFSILGVAFYNWDYIRGEYTDRVVFNDVIDMGGSKTYEFNFHFIGYVEAVTTQAGFDSNPRGSGRIAMNILSGDQWDDKINVRPARGGGGSHIVVRP